MNDWEFWSDCFLNSRLVTCAKYYIVLGGPFYFSVVDCRLIDHRSGVFVDVLKAR